MATITLPTFTDVVDQRFFIEPYGGPTQPVTYLDRFPEEVYNKAPDSHLVRFMYALLGPAGIGWLKKNYLEARLALTELGFESFDLERYYGDPFRFGRIVAERFDEDPLGLLPRETWDQIKAKDEAYRSRAIDFFNAARLGNTPEGMRLAGRSGLGHNVAIVENYKYLFDQHSDDPLGLEYFGKTRATEEFIVRPQREASESEQQQIEIKGFPTGGSFILEFNGQKTTRYQYAPITFVTEDYTLPTATLAVGGTGGWLSAGTLTAVNTAGAVQTITYTGKTATTLTGCSGGTGTLAIHASLSSVAVSFSNIPFDATAAQVQVALEDLSGITLGDVLVSGGPAHSGMYVPYLVTFQGSYGGQDVPQLVVLNGLSGGNDPEVKITTVRGGIESTDEAVIIDPAHLHNLQAALDLLRPVHTQPTVASGRGLRSRQPWQKAASSSQYVEVIRYVTGTKAVVWPEVDRTSWIESGVEKAAPRIKNDRQHHYVGFHNVARVRAYSDAALVDPDYPLLDVVDQYPSVHIGQFEQHDARIHPVLAEIGNDTVFSPDRALADYAEPLAVTTQDGSQKSLINGIYPATYADLPGVPPVKYKDEQFWASTERTSGGDLLEVSLGKAQPVNFLSFEALRKPFAIELAIDAIDLYPQRRFVPVIGVEGYPLPTSLHYEADDNPWVHLEFHFSNEMGRVPYTRFLRLEFTRQGVTPFPWSIDIRNLRVGRNVAL